MSEIEISHIMWSNKKIGVALHKMKKGVNIIRITAIGKDGKPYYPETFEVNREEVVVKYGISTINRNNLPGVWIPIADLEVANVKV